MLAWCANFASGADWFAVGSDTPAIDALGTCTSAYVIIQTSEYNLIRDGYASFVSGGTTPTVSQFTTEEVAALKYQAANPSPFNLSISDGSVVAGAVAATWAVAWACKALVRALGSDSET